MSAGQPLKLAILVPSADQCYMDFALSLAALVRHCAHVPTHDGQCIETRIFNVRTAILPLSRNVLLRLAQQWEADWMLCLDSDVKVPPDAFHRLLSAGKDAIGAGYATRQFFPLTEEILRPNQRASLRNAKARALEFPVDILAVHDMKFGCLLLRAAVLRSLPKPWVNYAGNPDVEPGFDVSHFSCEDRNFCAALTVHGVQVFAHMQLMREVHHIGIAHYGIDDTWILGQSSSA